jgi:hypothetical protein
MRLVRQQDVKRQKYRVESRHIVNMDGGKGALLLFCAIKPREKNCFEVDEVYVDWVLLRLHGDCSGTAQLAQTAQVSWLSRG